MIILDIETSGLTGKCGIWQIGTINLRNLSDYFFQEARIDDDDLVEEGALKVTGKTEKELRDKTKQPQSQMVSNYLEWVERQAEKLFFGQNVGWDITMIQDKCIKYNLHKKFLDIHGQRGNDLHTLAQDKYNKIYGKYLLDEKGKSKMNLGKTLEFCWLPDERIAVIGSDVVKEGEVHTALEDCKLEGEILYRLKFGKNLFPEYAKFEIPDYLK